MLSFGRAGQTGTDVRRFKFGKIFKNFSFRHTFRQHGEYIVDRDAQASDTGAPASFARFEGDVRSVVFMMLPSACLA